MSVPEDPSSKYLTKDEAQQLAGDAWDEDLWSQKVDDEGRVTLATVLAAAPGTSTASASTSEEAPGVTAPLEDQVANQPETTQPVSVVQPPGGLADAQDRSSEDVATETYINTALALTDGEKAEAARLTLAAAEAREKAIKKDMVLTEKKNDYSKSFSGSAADTKKEKDFAKMLTGDEDEGPVVQQVVDSNLSPVVTTEMTERYEELRAAGRWMKLMGGQGCWIWVHSLTHETLAMRPPDFEEEGASAEAKVFDPAKGFASCRMQDLMEELDKCYDEENKTPLLIDGSHDKNIVMFFEIKGIVADLSSLGLNKAQQRRKKIKPKEEMEKVRQQAVRAIKAGAKLCLNLGDFNGQDMSFKQGLCKKDTFPVEAFEDGGRKLLIPSNDPRCSAMFRSEDKEGGIVTWKDKFRLVLVSGLTVTDFKTELWASNALPNDHIKPIYVMSD